LYFEVPEEVLGEKKELVGQCEKLGDLREVLVRKLYLTQYHPHHGIQC
jgi:hypothetical protein